MKYTCYYWNTGMRWRFSLRPVSQPTNEILGGWHLTKSGNWKRRQSLKKLYGEENIIFKQSKPLNK